MHKKQYFPIVPVILFIQNAVAFDFEVECDKNIATEPAVSGYFQKYSGKWTGEWKRDEYFDL